VNALIPPGPHAYVEAYPMAPFGGLFLAVVGVSVLLGSLAMGWRNRLLIGGFAAACVALIFLATPLSGGLSPPSVFQVGALLLAIVVEIVLIRLAIGRLRGGDGRALQLVILFIVGFHFLIMAPAFGPVIVALGLLCMANAGLGLASRPLPLAPLWAADGLFKLIGGGFLVLLAPALTPYPELPYPV
jgi:hypothetical protein